MRRRTSLVGAGLVIVIGLVAFAGTGFLRFLAELPATTPATIERADGIVALTGGSARIAQAFELLAQGQGRRLLITGVGRSTTADEIGPTRPLGRDLVACCVDLDRNALNTLGNALETARWAGEHAFGSLIVVTASYHMPRTLMELRRVLPDTRLIAYPVVPEGFRAADWWCDLATARLIAVEYVKYAVASLRVRLDRPTQHRVRPAPPSVSTEPATEGSLTADRAMVAAVHLSRPIAY